MGSVNYIDIEWPELLKPIPNVKQDQFNRIRINKEVIPIIFVPGIMGSRLKNRKSGESVWDPDREIMCMLRKYGGFWNTPAQRKRMLIGEKFDPDFLAVDEKDTDHNKKFYCATDPGRSERGWGGVYWGSYGGFLEKLQTHKWARPVISKGEEREKELVGHCFEFPVHAFGYNWTDSNFNSGAKLAQKIDDVIWNYGSSGRLCKCVILISHSMGGLVCRSACKLHGAEDKVLGVIHGVQPATGAPAAYWRMKAGFERTGEGFLTKLKSSASAWVLGTNGEEVTCILGNAPGGLELLPNQHYTDNNGEKGWLRVPVKNNNGFILPKRDPYSEIYKLKTDQFWRLINPEWLDPNDKRSRVISSARYGNDAWEEYMQCIEKAEEFHEKLGTRTHGTTYQFYSFNVKTVDKINFIREDMSFTTWYEESEEPGSFPYVQKKRPSKEPTSEGGCIVYADDKGSELKSGAGNPATNILTMAPPNMYEGGGDGTVPDSSGSALTDVIHSYSIKSVEHQDAYGSPAVLAYVILVVTKLGCVRIRHAQ